MERVCPICNGLATTPHLCPNCGGEMEEKGALQDFIDDYSPYLDKEMGQQLTDQECVHLCYCPRCDEDVRIAVTQWLM